MTIPIPSPPGIPVIGHINQLDANAALESLNRLAQQYGGIYELSIFGLKLIIVSCHDLLNELSDEKRFQKSIPPVLEQLRNAAGDGLFTARVPEEQNWYIAHRLLMPCFGTASVYNMFDGMMDITSQLIMKWERFGPRDIIDPSADFTKLTLDAISLCSMSYRLNSFYREEPHPFATAMTGFLVESGLRANRPSIVNAMMMKSKAKYQEDQRVLLELVDKILQDHRANPPEKEDLVQVMLYGRDKETGMGLSDENIKNNLLTFLIAGHETTSGMLSFTVCHLLKNPEALRKLREEIDNTLKGQLMTVKYVNQLPYLLAVMRESMRLGPTAPIRSITPVEDTVLGGKYSVKKGDNILLNLVVSHRDPKVWGEDADKFRPERMLDGKFETLPPNAWQPFGYGMRACIGRAFAWQEAQIALVTILQRFDLVMHDPSYELKVKQTLTIKPDSFFIHALPRTDKPRLFSLVPPSLPESAGGETEIPHSLASPSGQRHSLLPLYVLYGSNTGTSESFAQRLASAATSHGFHASIGTLDFATEHIPKDGPVLIVTPSFEGQPADNAAHFVQWLEGIQAANALEGVSFGVFGCGNRDWVNTYQRIPKLIDELLAEHGASRLVLRGEGDASAADFFETFDQWEKLVWTTLHTEYNAVKSGTTSGLQVKTVSVGTSRAEVLRQRDTALGTVVENRTLTAPGAPTKLHIEIDLPESMSYRTGDYLAILPVNPDRIVRRVIARLRISLEEEVEIVSSAPTSLPVKKPIGIYNLLSGYVELQQPATTRDLEMLLTVKNSDASRLALKGLLANYTEAVFKKRLSVLSILEEHQDIDIPLETLLQMLPAMRIRQYSISSSPLWNAQRVSLTVNVVDAPALSGRDEPFLGVASTFLAGLRPGDKVHLSVRPSNAAFHPPTDPAVPLLMICAGSGLAPMRGFLQERALQKRAGRDVGTSLLFFGCRSPEEDLLYGHTDLKEWRELGIVDIRPAFSRSVAKSEGCRYVQDRLRHDKEDVMRILNEDAKVFVCGTARVAAGVKKAIVELIKERDGLDDANALGAFDQIMTGRYAMDIFE